MHKEDGIVGVDIVRDVTVWKYVFLIFSVRNTKHLVYILKASTVIQLQYGREASHFPSKPPHNQHSF